VRDEVILIEQFRIGPYAVGWDPWLLEGVAGIIEDGESPEDVARRETREEAGCEITDLVPVMRYISSPGACSETVALFCGRVDSSGAGGVHGLADEGEDIKVMVYPVAKAIGLLDSGRIVNAKTIIALQWLALNYADLKQRWLA
jgi:ADP-ribose pyrophosphatase